MRTYKQNVIELDKDDTLIIKFGNVAIEVAGNVNQHDESVMFIQVPRGHVNLPNLSLEDVIAIKSNLDGLIGSPELSEPGDVTDISITTSLIAIH